MFQRQGGAAALAGYRTWKGSGRCRRRGSCERQEAQTKHQFAFFNSLRVVQLQQTHRTRPDSACSAFDSSSGKAEMIEPAIPAGRKSRRYLSGLGVEGGQIAALVLVAEDTGIWPDSLFLGQPAMLLSHNMIHPVSRQGQ